MRITLRFLSLITLLIFTYGCSSLKNPKITLEEENPQLKLTHYSTCLSSLGKMLQVYMDNPIYIQSKDITDATGIASATGGEIPYNITEIVRSSVNKIGDRVVYVPYDPALMINALRLGSKFERPSPTLLLSGAITEYDRTLESKGDSFNLGTSFGGGNYYTDASLGKKNSISVSRITIDMNLTDYKRMVMLPRMQAINSIRVYNAIKDNSISFAIHGTGIGLSGKVKQIQGRHAAIRLLVELSVLEIIGKYASVPYWKCVPDGKPDPMVIEKAENFYMKLDNKNKIKALQQLLPYYGHNEIAHSGELDNKTKTILDALRAKLNIESSDYSKVDLYRYLYFNIPIYNTFAKSKSDLKSKTKTLYIVPRLAMESQYAD